ncbi:MAG: acetolactate synthase small subunit [Oscillospiraceae bacterium]
MKQTISVLVENHSGVLSRICGLFSRRGFNIDSLAVGPTNDPSVSRITIIADGNQHTVEQIEKQLNKLIEVIKVKTLDKDECLARECLIVKLGIPAEKRGEVMTIADIVGAKVMDLSLTTMTLEICDTYNHLERFEELIEPYNIIEMVRTGTIAISKGAETIRCAKNK